MANITKRMTKSGAAYRIKVSLGYDETYKQITKASAIAALSDYYVLDVRTTGPNPAVKESQAGIRRTSQAC